MLSYLPLRKSRRPVTQHHSSHITTDQEAQRLRLRVEKKEAGLISVIWILTAMFQKNNAAELVNIPFVESYVMHKPPV